MEEKATYAITPVEDEKPPEGEPSRLPVVLEPMPGYEANWDARPKSTPKHLIRQRPDGVLYVAWQDYAEVLDAMFGPGNWWPEERQVLVKPYVEEVKGIPTTVEEVVWRGWLIVPALPGVRREATGSMVRKKGMTYADALNSARSNALRRVAIEAIGIYRDVAGDFAACPTEEQMAAAVKAYHALSERIGQDSAAEVVRQAGFSAGLDDMGILHPDRLERMDMEPLLQALARAIIGDESD